MPKALCRYTRSGDAEIAYQVIGQGSVDILLVSGFPANLEILWEDPGYTRLMNRLSAFGRLVLFDRRGTGLSGGIDVGNASDLRTRVADIGAVADAAGCGRLALLGASDGAALAVEFAAAFPHRVRALVLHGGRYLHRGGPQNVRHPAPMAETTPQWGSGAALARMVPSRRLDQGFSDWCGRLERLSASPSAAAAQLRAISRAASSARLPAISAPALVLHRADDVHCDPAAAKEIAAAIPGASRTELPGGDHPIWAGDVDGTADAIEEFLTGERPLARSNRVLAALLVGQVLGPSAEGVAVMAARHLDERRDLLRDALPKVVARHGGRAQWSGRDRIDASFDGAARAAYCAIAIRESAGSLGIAIAQAIHAGEVDAGNLRDGAPLAVAVAIAASQRRPGILLSRLAGELISGSGFQFLDHEPIPVAGLREPVPVVGLASERHLEPLRRSKPEKAELDALTLREREILALVAEGLSNPAIALQLGLSEHTVKRHVANILLKLGLASRAAAASLMARQGTN